MSKNVKLILRSVRFFIEGVDDNDYQTLLDANQLPTTRGPHEFPSEPRLEIIKTDKDQWQIHGNLSFNFPSEHSPKYWRKLDDISKVFNLDLYEKDLKLVLDRMKKRDTEVELNAEDEEIVSKVEKFWEGSV